jgi:hypothetical protein
MPGPINTKIVCLSAPSLSRVESPSRQAIDRSLAIVAPIIAILLLANLLAGVLQSVATRRWNDPRLARGIALWYGYRLYPGHDAREPIIGTMHGPVPHLLYSGLAFLKDPTLLLIAGCALSCVLYFGSVLWLHLRAGEMLAGVYGFFACSALLLASRGGRFSGFRVHVDALALCCAVLAAGFVAWGWPLRARTITASAILAMLAVASKQTMAPVAVALPCFVWVTDGRRAFSRYVTVQIAASAAILAAMLALFWSPRDLLFNTFALALGQPRSAAIVSRIIQGLVQLRIELAVAVAPLILLAAFVALDSGSIREKIARHRWLVFLWMAALQLPIELRAWTTDGGADNHLGVVTLFVALATTLGLVELWKTDAPGKHPWTGIAARMLLIGMLLAVLTLPGDIFRDLRMVRTSSTQVAYNYERRHPGQIYFPLNPLAVLLAEGKLTHLDDALVGREWAGFPITWEQLAAGLPSDYELVAYPPDQFPHAEILKRLVQDKPLVQVPELQGWHVYRVKPVARSRSASQP